MRALAVFTWLLAVALAVVILWSGRTPPAVAARAVPAAPLLLWQPPAVATTPPAAVLPQADATAPAIAGGAPVMAPAAAPTAAVPVAAAPAVAAGGGCARLGVFPDEGWAASVAARLAVPAPAGSVAWRLQAVGEQGYYLVFPAVSRERLAARVLERRGELGRLVSRTVQPEPCTSIPE